MEYEEAVRQAAIEMLAMLGIDAALRFDALIRKELTDRL
jgi:hypothetical protein